MLRPAVRALLLAASLLGCAERNPEIECARDSICDRFDDGLCTLYEPTGHHWCTYPDVTCESRRRWSDLDVGDGLEGTCVEPRPDAGVDASIDAAIDTADGGLLELWNPTLATGTNFSCARDGADVRCWGYSIAGALGHGDAATIGDDEPASAGDVVDVGGDVVGVSAHTQHVCVLLDAGTVGAGGREQTAASGTRTHPPSEMTRHQRSRAMSTSASP
jgi:hypothetical protein